MVLSLQPFKVSTLPVFLTSLSLFALLAQLGKHSRICKPLQEWDTQARVNQKAGEITVTRRQRTGEPQASPSS